MARTFSREIDPVPDVDVLDWKLIERIGQTFAEYATGEAYLVFTAEDSRGAYRERDFPAFKAEVERQDEPPQTVGLSLHAEPRLFGYVWFGTRPHYKGGVFEGEDEAAVVHAQDRCADLLRQAHERREFRLAEEEAGRQDKTRAQAALAEMPPAAAPGSIPAASAPVSHRRLSFLRDVSVHVTGAVLAVVVVAAAVAIWAVLTH